MISRELFGKAIGAVDKYYLDSKICHFPYPRPAVDAIFPEFAALDEESLRRGFRALVKWHTIKKPSLGVYLDACQKEQKRLQAEEINAQRKEDDREKEEFARGQAKSFQDTEIAVKTWTLIRALLEGKITRRQNLEGLRHLDNLFPRAKFALIGSQLQDWYDQKGFDLDQPPAPTYL